MDAEFDSTSSEYPHCIILTDLATPKSMKYLKKCDDHVIITFFSRYFLFLGYQDPSKVCSVGNRWMRNQIPHPTSTPHRNWSKNTGRYVENMNTKSSFFLSSSKINKYYIIILTIILLIFPRRPILS